jgi:hypothetical protein
VGRAYEKAPFFRRLTVRVKHEPAADLTERLERRLGVPIDGERLPVGTLSRAGFKAERVVDEPAPVTAG